MNRIVATLYFVKSAAWSVEALTLTLWQGSIASTQRTNSIIANHKLYNAHHSGQKWLTTSSISKSSNVDYNDTLSTTIGCIDESVRRLLNKDDFEYIDSLVQERTQARWQGNYTGADDLKSVILNFSELPDQYEIFLQDIPRKSGGGSRWSLVPTIQTYDEEFLSGTKILQLAHAAMGLAVDDNQQTQTQQRQQYRKKSLEALVDQTKSRLEILLEETRTMEKNNAALDFEVSTKQTMVRNELGGRTAADAALWFALAGSKDIDLFHGLADIASWELNRFGQRPSCRSKNIYQILERFAAAGLTRHDKLEQVAHMCLLEKQQQEEHEMPKVNSDGFGNGDVSKPSYLNLHSDRSLLLIWKFATKQKKQQSFLRSAKKNWEEYRESGIHNATNYEIEKISSTVNKGIVRPQNERIVESSYNWDGMFKDTSRPLVVDVGCGMGVSLLGLASTADEYPSEKESARLLLGENMKWSDCNFVGVDLGALGIEYGRGVAHRWNLEGKNQFVIDSAEDFCQHLPSYPGEIRCCMIQFPTPFRLQNKDGGNSQLPASKLDGFMVTENLLETIHSNLNPKRGKLLLQSNCEDVAVWMRNLACRKVGFTAIDDDNDDQTQALIPQRIPQRTQEW
eukprot:CAMPEP_0168220136 /NCGR_PEP_ID=MMETSP0140_2-20121125/9030_1 /TAXON_ID=44445 /ORGANISM="Pseudo-nitzschia australis, Strain 10249 10 AB" /LENGTH=623 /DNA_ID=CAMNT_0008148759 /DNA_START=63 /DNA_END=1931 /DNA_ORIENTATION=+